MKENTFGVGFQLRSPPAKQQCPRSQRQPKTLLGPMGSLGLGENEGSAAILSQATLGLRYVPRAQFPLQNAAPRSTFGAVSEIGPRWVPPWLAMGRLLGQVQAMPFHAKSAVSAKENTFGVGFQLRSPPAKQ